jgi:trimeric autotransporter adhesin
MKRVLSSLVLGAICFAAAVQAAPAQQPRPAAQEPSKCTISGRFTAGASGLPGVAVTVTGEGVKSPLTTSSQLDGTYSLDIPGPGAYLLRGELGTFAPAAREVVVDAGCRARLDIALSVGSRPGAAKPATPAPPATTGSKPATGGNQANSPARTGALPGLAGLFQRVTPRVDAAGAGQAAATTEDAATIASHLSLPPGFAPETLTDTITASGSAGRTNDSLLFGAAGGLNAAGAAGRPGAAGGTGGGLDGIAGAAGMSDSASIRELTDMAGLNGAGGMLGTVVRIAGALQSFNKRPHGLASYDFSGSALNAAPYSITGQPIPNPAYTQQHFTATLGGLLKVPGLFDAGPRTTFILSYQGNRSSTVYSQYSTVPPAALRDGDFSALPDALIDPATHLPFSGNQIPKDRITASARSLLSLIPLPNQPGERLNYYYSTTTGTTSDDVSFRLVRNFGGSSAGRGGAGSGAAAGAGGRGGGARGGAGGAGGGMAGLAGMLGNLVPGMTRGSVNLNAGFHYRRAVNDQANPFPTISGTSHQTAWSIPVSVGFPLWGLTHNLQFQFNRNTAETTNVFAGDRNVAAEAGIAGVSADPFDWGAPALSFSSFSGLRDLTPSARTDQTITISDSSSRTRGKHTFRFGGDYRGAHVDSRTSANARGTFVFTGIYTATSAGQFGADFADYLLGLSQQATIQYGPGLERFRSRAFNLFVMDDWRVKGGLTINAGLRYEYQAPYWEASNRLVTLDVPPDFSAAVPVAAGATGPYTGAFPSTIVEPDRNNLAPRVAVAWKPQPRTTVRGGYAINYASVPYTSMVERMSAQPPFAVADTRLGALNAPLDMSTVFTTPSTATTTNNFGADRAYRLGYVHIWNADVQRELGRTWSVGAAYVGTKGSALDIQRAPNRGPTGLRIPGVQPFIWESSEGRSIMHSVSFRARRRLAQGVSGGATYTLSRSMDNASTIGGGAVVVAQNDKDLAAEWGLSSFDQRHRLSADFSWEIPFGQGRRWLAADNAWSKVFGGWILSGTVIASSGSPFTARVVGNPADVNRGTNGTLRADYNGAPISLSDPTVDQFFNTAAFSVPAIGTFGDAARNTIRGPGSTTLNMSVQKSVSLSGLRGFSVRVQATNVLNSVQWSTIDTVVNSPTFGHVVAVRPMRTVQLVARVLF